MLQIETKPPADGWKPTTQQCCATSFAISPICLRQEEVEELTSAFARMDGSAVLKGDAMKCSSCGSELVPGTTFCPICGAQVMGQGFDGPMSNTVDYAQQHVSQPQTQQNQQYWAQSQQFQPSPAPVPMSTAPVTKPRRGKKIAAGLVIAVAVIAVGIGGFVGFSFWQKTQHQKTVDQATAAVEKMANEQYGEYFGGFVPSDYVNPSTYKIKSVKVDNVTESNGLVNGSAQVVTENRSFRSTIDLTFTGLKGSGGVVSNVCLKSNKISTEPTRGIDFDEENGLTDVDSELEGSSCTVKQDVPGEAPWYFDDSCHQEYVYSFDQATGWCFDYSDLCDDDGDTEPMVDISGTYEDFDGDDTPDIYLKISNYDEVAGTISVELSTDYSLSRKDLSGRMVFKKDDVWIEEIGDSGFMGFRIGEVEDYDEDGDYDDDYDEPASADEITGAKAGQATLTFVFNPSMEGGISVFRGDDYGLEVQTGYSTMTGVTGGMMSELRRFDAWTFENNTPAPQFVKE